MRLPQPGPDPRPAAAPAGDPNVDAGPPQSPPGPERQARGGFLPPVLQRRGRRGAGPLELPEGPHEPVHVMSLWPPVMNNKDTIFLVRYTLWLST